MECHSIDAVDTCANLGESCAEECTAIKCELDCNEENPEEKTYCLKFDDRIEVGTELCSNRCRNGLRMHEECPIDCEGEY